MWPFSKKPEKRVASNPPRPPSSPAGQNLGNASADGSKGGSRVQVAFSNSERSWEESFDLLELLAKALRSHGHSVAIRGEAIEHPASGIIIRPKLEGLQPTDRGDVQTVTIIAVQRPDIAPYGPISLFEYQHSIGDSGEQAVYSGFDQWVQIDFFTLLAALNPNPPCTAIIMPFPATETQPARTRRVILGPVGHYPGPSETPTKEEHPFCPCCLFTNSFQAFDEQIKGDSFLGIRFYASRLNNGDPAADCRLNGAEFELGKDALRQYVQTWPNRGIEFRKQYVVLQTIPNEVLQE